MGFLGVYTALYDYAPQSDQELSLQEGDLLYVLEKSTEDEWWKAKRKSPGDDGEEPVGLIPSNYIQEAEPTGQARALYDYTRQTDEELSLTEDAALSVYDTSDPDWTLVGLDGEYGFAPANYIELRDAPSKASSQRGLSSKGADAEDEPQSPSLATSPTAPVQSPAAALAGILNREPPGAPRVPSPSPSPPSPELPSRRPTYTPEASDDEASAPPPPSLPARPASQSVSSPTTTTAPESLESPRIRASPPFNRAIQQEGPAPAVLSPGGFHLYNISEMVSVMGKRKKMPTTLGLNTATGTIMIAPEKSRDGPQQEWSGDKLTHYSIEGKHVFMDLVRPSKSVDFHAGAKDTAEEIVSALGEIAGAVKAEGLREVLAVGAAASDGQKRGQVLYDFVAQGDDEVTVGVGDEVIILDDTKSEEWWMVKRLKDGKEGVMPSSYVEVSRVSPASAPKASPLDAGRSVTERNRLEEERLAKQAVKSAVNKEKNGSRKPELGLGVALPQRGSSLMSKSSKDAQASHRSRNENRSGAKSSTSRSKPEASKIRTWTDRSGSFKVEAEFIGCTEGKIHLHKLNGVKIAVPVAKMSIQDLEFVERITGLSLDEDKPLSEIKRRSQTINTQDVAKAAPAVLSPTKAAASSRKPEKDDYDWFDFFLKCGVNPQLCERYASSFTKDSMDETVLPDITAEVLRTLGLKEGDILKVMKHLDNQYGRAGSGKAKRNVSFAATEVTRNGEGDDDNRVTSPSGDGGGLFSGPGGTLRNNTKKGRPAPPVQTKDVVDPKVFEQSGGSDSRKASVPSDSTMSPTTSAPPPVKKDVGGFDDDAWNVKPTKEQRSASVAGPSTSAPSGPPQPPQPTLTESMKELSLLSAPLQPVVAHNTSSQPTMQTQSPVHTTAPVQPSQAQTAGTGQFGGVPPGQMSSAQQLPPRPAFPAAFQSDMGVQPTGLMSQQVQSSVPPRLRPQAPPQPIQSTGSFTIPPPPRPLSAPQKNMQPSGFAPPPLQPQLTGVQTIGGGMQARLGGAAAANFPNLGPAGLQQFVPPGMPSQMQIPNQQINGLPPQATGPGGLGTGIIPQPTGFQAAPNAGPGFQPSQPLPNGPMPGYAISTAQPTGGIQPLAPQGTGVPFGLPPGPMQQQQAPPQQAPPPPLAGNINAFLPPALQPQPTGLQAPAPPLGQSAPPMPPIPSQPTIAPLQPQKTGPAPPVRFGIAPEAKKLVPQPTGRRANLSQATPENPFGF